MQKVGGARRAPRRRAAVAIVIGTMLALVGVVALAAPAYANFVTINADCDEVVVEFIDFDRTTSVHTNIDVEDGEQNSLGTRSDTTDATINTPPADIDISDLTSQSPDGRVKVKVDVDWVFDGEPHHDDNHIHLDCAGETTTSVSPTTAENSTSTTPTSVSPTTAENSTTTADTSPVTTAGNVTTSSDVGSVTTAGAKDESATTVVVSAGGTGTGGGSLPFTGGNSMAMLIAGLALVLGGAAAILGPRYRRRSSAS